MPIFVHAPAQCVNEAAYRYSVPPAIVFAIIKTENGLSGHGSQNRDGTVDWGPMQINDRWFVAKKSPVRRTFPNLDPNRIRTNSCVNVYIGTWILSTLIQRDHSLWTAVGHYHSYKPREAHKYRRRVYYWYRRIVNDWKERFGYIASR